MNTSVDEWTVPAPGGVDAVDARAIVDRTITSRRSIRQFLPTPLARETVVDLLDVAARAPSGHNTQAWRVHVLTGDALRALTAKLYAAFDDPDVLEKHRPVFDSYPAEWISPYIDRRRQVGKDLYTQLGIERGDAVRMREQLLKNYAFFGAPVGIIFTLPRVMVPGSVLDLGMFMHGVMIAARARGLDTCPQAAFATFHGVIAADLVLEEGEVVICGMSLGHADERAAANRVVTHREPAATFAVFHD